MLRFRLLGVRQVFVRTLIVLFSVYFALGSISPLTAQAISTEDCVVSDKLVNSCRPWLGAWTNGYGTTGLKAAAENHEQRIGRQLDIVHNYHGVGANTITNDERDLVNRPNTILYANWKPAAVWSDANGENATINAGIDQMADSIKTLGSKKIMFTIFHEPEDDVSTGTACTGLKGSAGSPADYVSMWRNVRERFDARGVTNVVWVMNYMGFEGWDCLVTSLWPGNDKVDWVMWDPYEKTASKTWDDGTSRFYNYLEQNTDAAHDFTAKPWGLGEFGVANATGQANAYSYYAEAKAALDAGQYPRLKAFINFDAEGTTGSRVSYALNNVYDANEQAAYASFANDPLLNGSYVFEDTTAPAVTLTQPSDGSTVFGTVQVTGSASDASGVTSASLIVDGGSLSTQPTTGESLSWNWDTTLLDNGQHSVQLSATDARGNVGLSPIISVVVNNPDVTAPTPPSALTATATADGHGAVLSWNAASDAVGVTSYDVYRDGAVVATVPVPTTTHSDAGLNDGRSYQYSVTARDAAGNVSAVSNVVDLMTPDVTAPSKVNGVTATTSGGTVSLSWSAASDNVGVAGYTVYRDGLIIGTSTNTTFNDSQVVQGKSYTYTVRARDAAGNSSEISTATVITVPDTTNPGLPGNFKAVAGKKLVTLSWTKATDNIGVAGYYLIRDGVRIATLSPTTTSYTDRNLVTNRTYYYQLRAFDAAGNRGEIVQASAKVK
jgi:fibronectin type 3 domain-containing protein/beta-mannanase